MKDLKSAPPPSIREVAAELGFKSPNAALKLILQMRDAGEVIYQSGQARSLRLVKMPQSGLPIVGSIPAGLPDPGNDLQTDFLQFDPASFGITSFTDAFALRVRGDSMSGRHFFEGDLVLFDRSAIPRHQDVVAALIDQECTLKTLIIEKGKTWLKAENPAYPDLIPAHDLQIQGVAKALIRIPAA